MANLQSLTRTTPRKPSRLSLVAITGGCLVPRLRSSGGHLLDELPVAVVGFVAGVIQAGSAVSPQTRASAHMMLAGHASLRHRAIPRQRQSCHADGPTMLEAETNAA